jgi:hypothetical protein
MAQLVAADRGGETEIGIGAARIEESGEEGEDRRHPRDLVVLDDRSDWQTWEAAVLGEQKAVADGGSHSAGRGRWMGCGAL